MNDMVHTQTTPTVPSLLPLWLTRSEWVVVGLGVCLLGFGVIVVALFTQRVRGASVSWLPAHVIGAAYLAFGVWALVGGFNPFFFVFVVPAVLLVVASWEVRLPGEVTRPSPRRTGL